MDCSGGCGATRALAHLGGTLAGSSHPGRAARLGLAGAGAFAASGTAQCGRICAGRGCVSAGGHTVHRAPPERIITCETPGARIYYTVDGSRPSASGGGNSLWYGGIKSWVREGSPCKLLAAVASCDGYDVSAVATLAVGVSAPPQAHWVVSSSGEATLTLAMDDEGGEAYFTIVEHRADGEVTVPGGGQCQTVAGQTACSLFYSRIREAHAGKLMGTSEFVDAIDPDAFNGDGDVEWPEILAKLRAQRPGKFTLYDFMASTRAGSWADWRTSWSSPRRARRQFERSSTCSSVSPWRQVAGENSVAQREFRIYRWLRWCTIILPFAVCFVPWILRRQLLTTWAPSTPL